MKIVFVLGLLLVLHNQALSKPVEETEGNSADYLQNDDYKTDDDYDDDSTDDEVEDETDEQFKFISVPQDIREPEHSDVSFPCDISENPATYTIMWKKNNEIIFQDTHIFTTFDPTKFLLKNVTTLVIKNIDASDAGEYSCVVIVSSDKEERLKHLLTIQTPAKITSLTSDKSTYTTGDKLELTCAAGEVDPKITWSLNGKRLGTGSKLIIENIGHDNSGDYQCIADNGIGQVDHRSLNIKVMHKPIVRLEKFTLNVNGDEYDVELRCSVRANPAPIVVWRKDGEEVKQTRRKNNMYILHLKKVDAKQFGRYSCSADNQVGKNEQHLLITNMPSKALYKGGDDTQGKEFNLKWEVESLYPISEYLLEYKKVSSEEWVQEHPEVTNSESGNLYVINYVLKNLDGGEYEVRVKSKNQWGWSELSKVITFTAHSAHHGHKEHKNKHGNKPKSQNEESNDILRESRVGGSTNVNSGALLLPSTTLLCLVALLMFNRH